MKLLPRVLFSILLESWFSSGAGAAPEAELRPGLAAAYRSLAGGPALERIDPKPAFALGLSSPHPRIAPGPFEARWDGFLVVEEEDEEILFGAYLCGELTVQVDGTAALRGRGKEATAWIAAEKPARLGAGAHRFRVEYRAIEAGHFSSAGRARLQIWWEGKSFSREPLPAWRLQHLDAEVSAAVHEEELRERGRAAAGRWGCAHCHRGAFPAVDDPPPGPALEGFGDSLSRSWLLHWLEDPGQVHPRARMPALFRPDREGFVERWIVAEHLLQTIARAARPSPRPAGDHRLGRRAFIGLACTACHPVPDPEGAEKDDAERFPLQGLGDRMSLERLAAFITMPHGRYPDGRMPRLPVPADDAGNIAAYLLLWSPPSPREAAEIGAPSAAEIALAVRRLRAAGPPEAALALIREKRCGSCHPGLPQPDPAEVPVAAGRGGEGCLGGRTFPRFRIDPDTRAALSSYGAVAGLEIHPSPFARGQRLLRRQGCFRCHARDTVEPPPLEEISSRLGGSNLETIPFQRTPRLTHAHLKYSASYLFNSIRGGVTGTRPARYSYRMPSFGDLAGSLTAALAESDGDLPGTPDPEPAGRSDPTLASLGPRLAGFEGYSCVSCHLWNGRQMADPDPGAIGPELTSVARRIRRPWFDRWLEDPARIHPRTPMPRIFPRGERAAIAAVLDGDPVRQRDALWSYFALEKEAPSPKPLPPLAVPAPAAGAAPLVAQIPLHRAGGPPLEALAVLFPGGDLLLYDVEHSAVRGFYTGARILRTAAGRIRRFSLEGHARELDLGPVPPAGKAEFTGYDRLPDGVRVRSRLRLTAAGSVEAVETFRLSTAGGRRRLLREDSRQGERAYDLPPPEAPQPLEAATLPDPGKVEGSLERPGYRAIAYPRPRTASNEDLVLPSALAVNPRDGRLYVASMKTAQVFVLRDPRGDGRDARFEDYTGGLFQEAYSMLAEEDGLYVLHRRNLTRLADSDGDGLADRFDRVAALSQELADGYDYGYGLVRDRTGAFVLSHAPYASTRAPGSGGALRLSPGVTETREELAFGFRNPLGWCLGPNGEVFATDNQGEWVAANKLVHVVKGRFYGFPNSAQKEHASKPAGKAAVWVPYGWARSVNGVAFDSTGGRFGPFAGQLFLAELMFGGAIIRASLEEVNGEYQGCCFPFWGKGLLGPLVLAFDPRGRLYVGGITEPGWMAQPDRGALFRIDFTGEIPFEVQTIRALPEGFRLVFTLPADPARARDAASYSIESYRYEYTGAYGSPELDRMAVPVRAASPSGDGLAVDLSLGPLARGRVYRIAAPGIVSTKGVKLVHPEGAYTLNEVPRAHKGK